MNLQRTTHDVQQGTGPWLRLREGFDTASEAPAALGVGKYVTRAELLRRKHTGIAEEHGPATLAKFRAGHEAEASARPLVEPIAGGDLYPVTMSVEVAGLRLLASLDGLTLDGVTAWETKLWNEELAANVRAGTLPEHYTVQMDQELMVSGAERCLFTCTDGTPERFVSCWYEADPAKFEALIDGWVRFHKDLAAYVLPEPAAEPVTAAQVETLPAVAVRMDGALVVQSNLPAFGAALKAFVSRVPRQPSTDQEFADTEAACKALKRAEEALDAAEANALASLSDVEAMRRMVADFRTLARDTRLASEKMVERRKRDLKEQAVMSARAALQSHVDLLNAELAPMRLLPVVVDFAGAIKGLRSIASMQDALDTALAQGKIAADNQARGIRANVATFAAQADGVQFLFADLGALVHKAADDFGALVSSRIAAHKAAEVVRENQRREAERVRQENEAAQASQHMAAAAPAPAPMAAPAPQAVSRPAAAPAPRADEPATLNLGAICGRLGFTVSAQFLADVLHIQPARTDKASKLYTERQFAVICNQLISHVSAMAELYAGEPA